MTLSKEQSNIVDDIMTGFDCYNESLILQCMTVKETY